MSMLWLACGCLVLITAMMFPPSIGAAIAIGGIIGFAAGVTVARILPNTKAQEEGEHG